MTKFLNYINIFLTGGAMFYSYLVYYLLGFILLPGIFLGIWAQTKVYTTFNQFNQVETKRNIPANQVARSMLDAAGYSDIKIQKNNGELTDNFNPKTNVVSLSNSVYNQSTVSAVGVAAHEIGHVFQHKQKYGLIMARNILVPVINFSVMFTWPLIIVGLILETTYYVTAADILIYLGIGIYALNIVLCLITLPIELNASKRAHKMLLATGEVDVTEAEGVKKVLDAAAWTYVAALLTSILSLLRLISFVFMLRGRR